MNRYQNGKIYTIRSHHTDKFYIGSTCLALSKRLSSHKRCMDIFIKGKGDYISSYAIIKYDDCYIELLEECKCDNKEQLCRKEGELIRLHKDKCINHNIAGRTKKEYLDDNKDARKIRTKKYYEANKEKMLQQSKQYREANKDVKAQQDKIYRELNKDKISKQRKGYYESNKEKIAHKHNQINICECGETYTVGHVSRHLRSKRHQQLLLEKEEKEKGQC